jgi:mRNA interferase MazF
MRRGEVWWVSFPQAQVGEIRKTRPGIIVSNNVSNLYINRIQVVPTTSNTSRVFSSETIVIIRGRQSKAMADQIATVAKEHIGSRIGHVTAEELAAVERAIRYQLDLG